MWIIRRIRRIFGTLFVIVVVILVSLQVQTFFGHRDFLAEKNISHTNDRDEVIFTTRGKNSTLGFVKNYSEDIIFWKKITKDLKLNTWKYLQPEPTLEETEFTVNWCRIEKARTDLKSLVLPCLDNTVWGQSIFSTSQRTNPATSYISFWDLQPVGRYSRFFIRTVSISNEEKSIGGDSWRVHLRGPSSVAPMVFDHRNGSYEVLFLVMDSGRYRAEIFLDYTLCDGLKDPPQFWFRAGNSQGKNQPDDILHGNKPFLMQEFRLGELITLDIIQLHDNNQTKALLGKVKQVKCSCSSLLWNGLGRWTNGFWQPYLQDTTRLKVPTNQQGSLIIFGDSVANGFYKSITSGPYKDICTRVFASCKVVYNWIYNMKGYWGDGVTSPREPLPDGKDYDQVRVLNDVREVLYDPLINEHSVLVLNWGIHFAAVLDFAKYRTLITEFIRIIKHGEVDPKTNQFKKFKGRLIWKTTTAINRHRFPNPHKDVRRFLTFPRVLLFNAFATSAMCEAGIDVMDVYPISDAYPEGTVSQNDPVHYEKRVFQDVERLLFEIFKP